MIPSAEPATSSEIAAFDQASPHREQEGKGQVGRRVVEHTGRVGHDHSAGRTGLDPDPVVADPEVGDDTQPRQQMEGHELVRDDQSLDVGARRVETCEGADLDLVQLVECRARVAARGEDLHRVRS